MATTKTPPKTGFEKPVAYAVEPEVKEPSPPPAVPPAATACAPVHEGATCPNCGWNLSDPVKGIEPHEIFAPTTAT